MATINGFRVKNGVYQAKLQHDGMTEWRAVQLYVESGSRMTKDYVRYEFSNKLSKRFENFVCTGRDNSIDIPATNDYLGENMDLISNSKGVKP